MVENKFQQKRNTSKNTTIYDGKIRKSKGACSGDYFPIPVPIPVVKRTSENSSLNRFSTRRNIPCEAERSLFSYKIFRPKNLVTLGKKS